MLRTVLLLLRLHLLQLLWSQDHLDYKLCGFTPSGRMALHWRKYTPPAKSFESRIRPLPWARSPFTPHHPGCGPNRLPKPGFHRPSRSSRLLLGAWRRATITVWHLVVIPGVLVRSDDVELGETGWVIRSPARVSQSQSINQSTNQSMNQSMNPCLTMKLGVV